MIVLMRMRFLTATHGGLLLVAALAAVGAGCTSLCPSGRCALRDGTRRGVAFHLVVQAPAGTEAAANARFQQFASDIEQRMPAPFRGTIRGTVTVTFDLTAPLSATEPVPATGLPAALARHTRDECRNLGRVAWRGQTISLNRALARAVAAGPEAAPRLVGFHGDWYRLAVGTALQQLAVLHERERPAGALSATLEFRKLIGWQSGLGGSALKNLNLARSPCACEARSPGDFFAVNLEYYLMDPEYAWRRPAEFAYFRQYFPDPFPARTGRLNSRIFLADRYVPIDLAPERVSAVHYVVATPGEQMGSGFGHSLLRFVMPPPDAPAGIDAMRTPGEHAAIGYQAFTLGDLTINPIGGLFGRYPSLPFVYLFTTVQSRYVSGELRELRSYPLVLSDAERRMLVYRMLENYWEYQGAYKFLTQNCATELRDDIQGCLLGEQAFRSNGAISPNGVARVLRREGLLDMAPFDDLDRARRDGYYFPDYDAAKQSLARLAARNPALPYRKQLNAFVEKTSAAQRQTFYRDMVAQDPSAQAALASEFYIIECRIRLLAHQELLKAALRLIRTAVRPTLFGGHAVAGPPGKPTVAEVYKEAAGLLNGMLPGHLLPPDSGYGIPLAAEMARLPTVAEMDAKRHRLSELRDVLIDVLKKEQPELCARYFGADANLHFFLQASARP